MFERKNLIGLLLIFGLTLPSVLFGQSADQVKKLQQALIKMQLEMEEYQGELQDQFSEQRQLVEESKTEIAQLNRLSQELQEKVKTLETELALSKQQIEEMRASSSKAQFNELSLLVSSLMLAEFGDSSSLEEQLLEMLNEGSNLPPDQLILMLAESHKRRGALEESLGFYGLLISDHPESDFLNKAIFDASELLGKLDQSDQQLALLESLSESKGEYGEKARERLAVLSN